MAISISNTVSQMNPLKPIVAVVLSLLFPTTLASTEDNHSDSMKQIINVNQLTDVSPSDLAYEALRSLSDRSIDNLVNSIELKFYIHHQMEFARL